MPETPPIRLRLAEVRLERFKAAFKPEGPIIFRPFNAFIGRNGAGKSTVIEGCSGSTTRSVWTSARRVIATTACMTSLTSEQRAERDISR